MRRVLLIPLVAVALAAALAAPASAAPLTFQFAGSVTQISDPDPFGGLVGFGTLFSGSYTFESAASDSIPLVVTDGSYLSVGAPYGISVDFDGDLFGAFSIVGVTVNTRNGSPDQYGVFASDGPLTIELLFEAFAANPFANDLLPQTPPNLASFNSRVFTFRSDDLNQVEIQGTIDSLTGPPPPTAVPEPSTLLMTALGLAAAARRRRARV